jgi:hypothetical protein
MNHIKLAVVMRQAKIDVVNLEAAIRGQGLKIHRSRG